MQQKINTQWLDNLVPGSFSRHIHMPLCATLVCFETNKMNATLFEQTFSCDKKNQIAHCDKMEEKILHK